MISKFASLGLAILILFQSIPAWAGKNASTCENGECIPALIRRLENLNGAYRGQCLPKNIKAKDIKASMKETA